MKWLGLCVAAAVIVYGGYRLTLFLNDYDRRLYAAIAAKREAFAAKCEALGGMVVMKVGGGLLADQYDDCAFPPMKVQP